MKIILKSNGNRIKWSPIRSVIIRVKTKSDDCVPGVRFVYHESYYQSIKKITNSEKRRIAELWKKGKICMKRLTKEVLIVEWLIWTATLNVIGLLDHR